MSSDEQSDKECPLCMEPLEIDDINFYPCKCEYQICRFCWHRLRTDENGLCPACRQPYPEDPVNFKPLTASDVQKIKSEKKQKQQQQRIKISESRKHLSSYRVLQKNLVYVVGLSARVADAEILKKSEYFGKYGRIIKVAVGSSIMNGPQSASCTAYVTYARYEDALRAIQAVNNAQLDGRVVKASLGTTKYCSSFLRSQPCHKPECMYLHDVADNEVSFTKDDMHLGRHTEYEKKLIETTLLKDKGQRERSHPLPNCRRRHSQSKSGDRGGAVHHGSPSSGGFEGNSGKGPGLPTSRSERTLLKGRDDALFRGDRNAVAARDSESGPDSRDGVLLNGNARAEVSSKQGVLGEGQVERFDGSGTGSDGSPEICKSSPKVTSGDVQPPTEVRSRLRDWTSPERNDDEAKSLESSENLPHCKNSREDGGLSNALDYGGLGINEADESASLGASDWQRLLGLSGGFDSPKGSDVRVGAESPGMSNGRARQARHTRLSIHSDDDLGFDPYSESAKGLADLLEEEKAVAPLRHVPLSSNSSMSSAASSLMSLGLQCGWPSMNGGLNNGRVAPPAYDYQFSTNVEPPRAVNAFGSSGIINSDMDYFSQSGLGSLAAGQPQLLQQQHQSLFTSPPRHNAVHSAYAAHSLKQPMLAPSSALSFADPPPGLSCLSTAHQQRYPPYSSAGGSLPIGSNQLSPPLPDATQVNVWQEELKALLPSVNVRFLSEMTTTGFPSSSRTSVSSPGSSQMCSQQQPLPLPGCYGQTMATNQTPLVGSSLGAPLTMLSLNSLTQTTPQWMSPPPGFPHISKR